MHRSPMVLNWLHQWIVLAAGLILLPVFTQTLFAAIIGTNSPAQPLTAERIAALPRAQRSAWMDYLKRSSKQWRTDQAFLRLEMRKHNLRSTVLPPAGRSTRSMPLDQADSWYGSEDARRIANIIVSFQTPAGGWSKNLDMTQHARAPGEAFAPNNASQHLADDDFDMPRDASWDYVGTFDNDATTTEMLFLAKVAAAGTNPPTAYHAAFLHGLDYIFDSQYPNGGWPQVWPLQGGYHDAITFNDNAMLNVLTLLRSVSGTNREFAFVPKKYRARAVASLQRGLACVLATQIVVRGHRTVWCQQHDALTLQPVSARNYEMPAQVSGESADLMIFLMEQNRPSPELVAAVIAAAGWFEQTKISGVALDYGPGLGRHLVAAPGDGPMWARYYEIGTDRPIFGDRDKSIHNDLNEISAERRNGYSWYNEAPKRVLERLADWKVLHGP